MIAHTYRIEGLDGIGILGRGHVGVKAPSWLGVSGEPDHDNDVRLDWWRQSIVQLIKGAEYTLLLLVHPPYCCIQAEVALRLRSLRIFAE